MISWRGGWPLEISGTSGFRLEMLDQEEIDYIWDRYGAKVGPPQLALVGIDATGDYTGHWASIEDPSYKRVVTATAAPAHPSAVSSAKNNGTTNNRNAAKFQQTFTKGKMSEKILKKVGTLQPREK